MKKTTVTIGIPAYQSESNIAQLLNSLVKQKQIGIKIENILVYADGCTDKTIVNARSVKSKIIQVMASGKNKGYAFALQSLINKSKSDVFVGLNDDIKIISSSVIENLVKPFTDKKVGIVGGNIKALTPKTFIGRCIYASYLVFEPMRYGINRGHTDLTCDGKIFALSRGFAKTLNLKKTQVGNVDIYLYYENLKQGRVYKFAKKAEIWFRLPETIDDFQSQEVRARVSRKLMQSKFKKFFASSHKLPKMEYLKSAIRVFKKYPLETIAFKLVINNLSAISKKSYKKWDLALTTKKLALLASDFESWPLIF